MTAHRGFHDAEDVCNLYALTKVESSLYNKQEKRMFMKNLITKLAMGFAVISFSFVASAAVDTTVPPAPVAPVPAGPNDLSEAMKAMSGNLKAISEQVQNKALNAQSAVLADQLVTAVGQARAFFPKSIAGLADKDQPAAKELYLKMMDQTAELSRQLAASFRANDNVKAVELLNQLVGARKQGHGEFKP